MCSRFPRFDELLFCQIRLCSALTQHWLNELGIYVRFLVCIISKLPNTLWGCIWTPKPCLKHQTSAGIWSEQCTVLAFSKGHPGSVFKLYIYIRVILILRTTGGTIPKTNWITCSSPFSPHHTIELKPTIWRKLLISEQLKTWSRIEVLIPDAT